MVNYTLRCRACEGYLLKPVAVRPKLYGIVENEHGAVIRRCASCNKLWLGFVQKLPNLGMKVVMKMIDKLR